MTQNQEIPYLTAAIVCERILQEKDGVLSLIRLVDTMTLNVLGAEEKEGVAEVPPVALRIAVLLSFRAGPARGKREVSLSLFDPNAKQMLKAGPFPLALASEEQGQNINVELTLALKDEGLYWFEVEMLGQVLSRMPMIIKHVIQPRVQSISQRETPNVAEQ